MGILYKLRADQVPEPMRIPYVLHGYRYGGTNSEALQSVFRIHNETLNIWSMAALFPLAIGLFIYGLAHGVPFIPLFFNFLTPMALLPGSLGNHIFCSRNPVVHAWWRRMDVTGILVSTVTMNIALSYTAFAEQPIIRILWPMLGVLYASYYIYKSWTKDYTKHGLPRKQYTLSAGGGVLLYLVPVAYSLLFGSPGYWKATGGVLIAASLLMGAFLFAHHLPESLPGFHGKFCYCTGHAFMHVLLWTTHIGAFLFISM